MLMENGQIGLKIPNDTLLQVIHKMRWMKLKTNKRRLIIQEWSI